MLINVVITCSSLAKFGFENRTLVQFPQALLLIILSNLYSNLAVTTRTSAIMVLEHSCGLEESSARKIIIFTIALQRQYIELC